MPGPTAASELGDQWTGHPVLSWLAPDKGKSEGASYFFRCQIIGERKAVSPKTRNRKQASDRTAAGSVAQPNPATSYHSTTPIPTAPIDTGSH